MIHDNNYAAGKTSARDLGAVHDTAKSLLGFITDQTRGTRQLPTDTDRDLRLRSDGCISVFTSL